jgi:TonB family protein
MERRLSGIPITGPLANRPVRYQEAPEYPEWARAQGIEATVELIFKVGPDGRVKNDIIVAKGSGEPRLDRHVMNAVLRWIFEPLPEEAGNREDVGTVVFRFSMK